MNSGGSSRREVGVERPVLLGLERLDLALALHDEPHRDRLHAPGGEPAPHLLPEDGADLVADEPVEDAARLLRVELLPVEVDRVLDGLLDRVLRDLVEEDAPHAGVAALGADLLGDVPGDRLALAIGVGREEDARRRRGRPA